MAQATCIFCGKEGIDPERDYRKVSGFTKRRVGGGTNALKLTENHDEWAHRLCVDMQAKGNNIGQESLI
jgi:hypothetical protein